MQKSAVVSSDIARTAQSLFFALGEYPSPDLGIDKHASFKDVLEQVPGDHTREIEWLSKHVKLETSIQELRILYKKKVPKTFEELGETKAKAVILRRCKALASIYEDLYFQRTGRRIRLTTPYRTFESHKCWGSLVKLDRILTRLGVHTAERRRMYLNAVIQSKKWPKKLKPVPPLQSLASPLNALDYLTYLVKTWYARHSGTKDLQRAVRLTHQSSYQEWESLAVSHLGRLKTLYGHCGSAFSAEIPFLLEDHNSYLLVAFSSPVIKSLWLNKLLGPFPEFERSMNDMEAELNKDFLLQQTLKRVRSRYKHAVGSTPFIDGNDSGTLELMIDRGGEQYGRRLLRWYEWLQSKLEEENAKAGR